MNQAEILSAKQNFFKQRIVLFANSDWYLFNFRRSLAAHLRATGWKVVLLSPEGPYGARLIAEGYDWRPIPMRRSSLNPFRELALILWLSRLLRGERPHVIHSFTVKAVIYGAIAARLAGVRARVSAVAGLGFVFTSARASATLLRPMVRVLLRFALGGRQSRIILQNPDDVELFQAQRLAPPTAIRHIAGSGVNLTRFTSPAKIAKGQGPVVMAARLLWDKGIGEFVEAAARLRSEGRALRFVIAGDTDPGNPAAIDATTLDRWKVEGPVEWLGQVEDMPSLISSAAIFVLPTYYGEGVPRSLIEAAACARPLITTDWPGCREVVAHEVDGLLVPVRDAKALAAAIARLADDPDLATKLGTAARQKAVEQFDEAIVIRQTVEVYEELLGRPRSAPRRYPAGSSRN